MPEQTSNACGFTSTFQESFQKSTVPGTNTINQPPSNMNDDQVRRQSLFQHCLLARQC